MHPRAKAAYIAELIETNARNAKRTVCQRCGQLVLTGDDHDRVAYRATVDEVAISPVTEMLVIFAGRSTYDASITTDTIRLFRREPWHVHSANQPHPVFAEHHCEGMTK